MVETWQEKKLHFQPTRTWAASHTHLHLLALHTHIFYTNILSSFWFVTFMWLLVPQSIGTSTVFLPGDSWHFYNLLCVYKEAWREGLGGWTIYHSEHL